MTFSNANNGEASTSIASAQLIAMSSIISFDIYGTYINTNPSDKQLIRWSHIGVVASSLFISTLATAFHLGGVDMTWLLYAIGNMINPGVFPTCFALLWKGQTQIAAITAPLVGMAAGISVWMGTSYALYGEVTIASTGGTLPNLYGCVTAFILPLIVSVGISLVKPANFDWNTFSQIQSVRSEHNRAIPNQPVEDPYIAPEKLRYMAKMSRWAAFWYGLTICGHILLWPLAMYGAKYVFSKKVRLLRQYNTM